MRSDSATQRIYLTFDDGPDRNWTPQILDLLAEADMHATFFAIGRARPVAARSHAQHRRRRACDRQSHVQSSPSLAHDAARGTGRSS